MGKVVQLTVHKQVEVSKEVFDAVRRQVWEELLGIHKEIVDASSETMGEAQANALKQTSEIFLECYKEVLGGQ